MWDVAKTEHYIDKILHTYKHSVSNTTCLQHGNNSVYNNTQI